MDHFNGLYHSAPKNPATAQLAAEKLNCAVQDVVMLGKAEYDKTAKGKGWASFNKFFTKGWDQLLNYQFLDNEDYTMGLGGTHTHGNVFYVHEEETNKDYILFAKANLAAWHKALGVDAVRHSYESAEPGQPLPTFESFVAQRANESGTQTLDQKVAGLAVRVEASVDQASEAYAKALADLPAIEKLVKTALHGSHKGGKLTNVLMLFTGWPQRLELRVCINLGPEPQARWKAEYQKVQNKLPRGRYEAKWAWEASELYKYADGFAQELGVAFAAAGLQSASVSAGLVYSNDGPSSMVQLGYY